MMCQIKKENLEKFIYFDEKFIEVVKSLSIETHNREIA